MGLFLLAFTATRLHVTAESQRATTEKTRPAHTFARCQLHDVTDSLELALQPFYLT